MKLYIQTNACFVESIWHDATSLTFGNGFSPLEVPKHEIKYLLGHGTLQEFHAS